MKLAEKVVQEGLTVRQTERLAPLFSVEKEETSHREPLPQSYKRAAQQLRKSLNTNVRVKRVRNRNKIEIEFANEDELARLVDMLDKAGMEQAYEAE